MSTDPKGYSEEWCMDAAKREAEQGDPESTVIPPSSKERFAQLVAEHAQAWREWAYAHSSPTYDPGTHYKEMEAEELSKQLVAALEAGPQVETTAQPDRSEAIYASDDCGYSGAWDAVANQLIKHNPRLYGRANTGLECALIEIQRLQALEVPAEKTDALCPHGFVRADNVCGPCSEGRPSRPPSKASGELRRWEFDRYRDGKLKAQGIVVHAATLDEALAKALELREDNRDTIQLRTENGNEGQL